MAWNLNGSFNLTDEQCESIVRDLTTGGNDTCEVVLAVPADTDLTDAGIIEEAACDVRNGGTLFFNGVIERITPVASGDEESITLQLASPWYWLERIVYQQSYGTGDTDTPKSKSRVQLGVDDDGSLLNTAGAILAVLAYANTKGAGITIGSILSGAGVNFPPIEMVDSTCAECIRAILRWHPDAVIYWDHAGTGALHIKLQTALGAALSLASAGDGSNVTDVSLSPRQDRKIKGVVINYETTTTVDGVAYTEVTQDISGSDSGKNVAVFTIPLQGANIVTQEQQCLTEDIPQAVGDVTDEWLVKHFPEIAACMPGGGLVEVTSVVQVIDEDAKVGPGTVPATYPRALINGAVHEWMTGISAAPTKVQVTLRWMGNASDNLKFYKLFNGAEKKRTFEIELTGTDAVTKTYRTVAGVPGEVPPAGLAASYKASLQTMMVAGSLSITEAEVATLAAPGKLISLTGDFPCSNSLIQTVRTSVFDGATRITFGPGNPRLNPVSFVELLRAGTRNRPVPNISGGRASADTSYSGHKIKGAMTGRAKNTAPLPPAPSLHPFAVTPVSVSESSGSIKVAEGWLVTGIAGIPDPEGDYGPQPEDYIKYLKVAASGSVSCNHGDTVWGKVEYGNSGGYLLEYETGGMDIGTGTDVVATNQLEMFYMAAEGIDEEAYVCQATRPAGQKGPQFFDWIPIAEISIVDNVMSILPIQTGPVHAPVWCLPDNLFFSMSPTD